MPNEGLTYYFTVVDNGSPGLARISDKTKALDKATQQLADSYKALKQANDPLIKQQAEIEEKLHKTESALASMSNTGSDNYRTMCETQKKLQEQLQGTKNLIEANEKAYKNNMETVRKNAANETWGNTVNGLLKGQTGQKLASSIGELSGSLIGSAFGESMGNTLTSTLGGTLSGAMSGLAFGLPGIVAGGLLGGISGYISGWTEEFEAEDDAFKEYYKGLYKTVNESTESMLTSGTALAAARDYLRIEKTGQEAGGSYNSLMGKLEETMSELSLAGGESYINKRKSALAEENEAYSGALGEAVAEVNRIAGENKANMENLSERYTREALSAVLMGDSLADTVYDDATRTDLTANYCESLFIVQKARPTPREKRRSTRLNMSWNCCAAESPFALKSCSRIGLLNAWSCTRSPL